MSKRTRKTGIAAGRDEPAASDPVASLTKPTEPPVPEVTRPLVPMHPGLRPEPPAPTQPPSSGKIKRIYFTSPYGVYNSGETAGFAPHIADGIVKKRLGHVVNQHGEPEDPQGG